MKGIAGLFPRGLRRRAAANLRLAGAYKATFGGNATQEDIEIVLTDLAEATGFYRVSPAGTSAEARAFADGRRDVMSRILNLVNLPSEKLTALHNAALAEELTTNEEGDL